MLVKLNLLKKFIRLAIAESALARVPNQLISPDESEESDDGEEANEACGMGGGGVMGYTAPLGLDPDELGRKKNKTGKK